LKLISSACFFLFQLIPLLKRNEKSAAALMNQLRKEAEELRKEKKRSTISGIHRYEKCHFICLFQKSVLLDILTLSFVAAEHFLY